ncbi:hypothetical protein [Spirosoma koreense]
MHKLFVLTVLALASLATSAQVLVDGENVNDLDITYCQMIGTNRTGLSNTHIWIDYGQPKFSASILKLQRISGRDGQAIKFNTVIDALNFITTNGWELVSTSVMADKDGDVGRFVYLLRRRK